MKHGRFSSLTLVLLGVLLFVAGAGAATLAVSTSQPKAGTAAKPTPETLSVGLSQIGYAGGKPSRTLVSIDEQLPKGFNNRLALFPICPASEFASVGNTPPPCPTGSQVGTLSFKAYVPSLGVTATAAGNIYRTGNNALESWVLATIPGYKLAVAVPAKLTVASSSAGPTANFDLSAAINFGVTADITDFASTWSIVTIPVTTTVTTPAERSAIIRSSSTSKKKDKTRTVTTNQPESVFETTACPAGTWAINAVVAYKTGGPETDTSSIACAPATSSAPAPTTPTTAPTTTTTPCAIPLGKLCLRASTRMHVALGPRR